MARQGPERLPATRAVWCVEGMDVREATEEHLQRYASLRGSACPPGHFIGDGEDTVRRMLAHGVVVQVIGTPERLASVRIPSRVDTLQTTPELLNRVMGYRYHNGVMALGRIPPEPPIQGTLHVALDGISNAENVGAILRTCAGFGVHGVLVGPRTCTPWSRRAVRVSMAAPLVVPVHPVEDLVAAVAQRESWAAHLYGNCVDYRTVDFTRPCCIVLGSEDTNVSEPVLRACKGHVRIPMAAGWDCLNVAASAAVLLAEVRRQRDGSTRA